MSDYKIKNLEDVLCVLKKTDKIINQEVTQLTSVGDNYGSLMLLVKVTYKSEDGKEKTIQVIAKQIPENDWLRKMFRVDETFKKELGMYKVIIPILQEFQKEQGVSKIMNFFPNFYGGRFNLHNSEDVDENGVIFLENLKLTGFTVGDRMTGLDHDTTVHVLENLAVFHAVPIALKMKKPGVFKDKILPYLKIVKIFDDIPENETEAIYSEKREIIKSNEKTAAYADRVDKALRKGNELSLNTIPREPFATITHNDFWVNNTMIKLENKKIVDNKFIDFQILSYGSPAADVIFFLMTSVKLEVIKGNFDKFLKIYHKKFIETLAELKCDTERFSFDEFSKELDREASETQFFHSMVMLSPIHAIKEDVKELKDMDGSDFGNSKVNDAHRQKAWFIAEEFVKRNWI